MAEGQCLCHAVRWSVASAGKGLVSFNHSRLHREWTGAAWFTALLVPAAAVTWEDPGARLRTWSGARMFCADCGSPVAVRASNGSTLELNCGLMRGMALPAPRYHINCSDANPALLALMQDGLARHDRAPPAVMTPPGQSSGQAAAAASPAALQPIGQPPALAAAQPAAPPAGESGVLLLVQYAHIVDENSPAIKDHGIISVPPDSVVRLVGGTLEAGLGEPYGDYVEVEWAGRRGKISKNVVVLSPNLLRAPGAAHPTSWGSGRALLQPGGLADDFSRVDNIPLGDLSIRPLPSLVIPAPAPVAAPAPASWQPAAQPAWQAPTPAPALSGVPSRGVAPVSPAMGLAPTPAVGGVSGRVPPPAPPTMGMPPPALGGGVPPPAIGVSGVAPPPASAFHGVVPPPALGRTGVAPPPALGMPGGAAPPPPTGDVMPQPPSPGTPDAFISSPTFQGPRAGYSFQTAHLGVGYYKDAMATPLSAATGPPGVSRGPPGVAQGPPGVAQGPPGVTQGPPGVTRRW
jgi:hypothetical protein